MKKGNAWIRWGVVTVVMTSVLWSTVLIAAPPDDKGATESTESVTREFNFDLDEVTVDVLKPDATMVEVMRQKARRSLIRIRMDFIKEIVRSAEDI